MTTATVKNASVERKSFFTGSFSEDADLVSFDGRNARPTRWNLTAIEVLNADGTVERKIFSLFLEAPASSDPKISVAIFRGAFSYPSFPKNYDHDYGYYAAGPLNGVTTSVLDAVEFASGIDLSEAR